MCNSYFSDNDSDSSEEELSHLLSSRRASSLARESSVGSQSGRPLETMVEESET
jgi:hypothetical protein